MDDRSVSPLDVPGDIVTRVLDAITKARETVERDVFFIQNSGSMSPGESVLAVQHLQSLMDSLPKESLLTEITVAQGDWAWWYALLSSDNPFSPYNVMRVYVDPTLQPREWYAGKPDPERLGERYKDYLVKTWADLEAERLSRENG